MAPSWWRGRATPAPPPPPPAREESGEAWLHRLRWTIVRRLASRFGGDEVTILRGPGLELAEVRQYQPGDDVRHIDWNVTARTQTPHVRETQTDRSLDVWFVLDLSASTAWGTAECLKRDRAADFLAVAGRLLGGHGNRLGALFFAERPLGIIPPAGGRSQLVRLVSRARATPPPGATGPTDLIGALNQVGRVAQRRALVIVVSDFLAPGNWQSALRRLVGRHEVVAVRLSDPREGDLPDIGLVTLEDPETGQQLVVDTSDRRLRERYAAAAAAQAEQFQRDLNTGGIDQLILGTDTPLLPTLVRFLETRRRRRHARGPSTIAPGAA